jgi:predicted  nucleic acid-binding Zn-ribbon protein
MASASTGPVASDPPIEEDRIATLEVALERSERRREATEAWVEFLEEELEARDRRLQAVIEQYEAQLEEARQCDPSGDEGLWARLAARIGW